MARLLRRRHLRDLLFVLGLAAVCYYLLRAPQDAIDAAKSGLKLCANVIVPSLFPFFVLSSLVIHLGLIRYLSRLFAPIMYPLFGLSGTSSAALALGMIGGYPVGARTALTLYESRQISRAEAERLLAFCNNCGPAFLFGVVGAGVFSSSSIGLLLYLIHIAASLLIGMLYRLIFGPVANAPSTLGRAPAPAIRFPAAFTNSVRDALTSTLNICAFIVCFTILIRFAFQCGLIGMLSGAAAQILSPMGIPEDTIESLLVGVIELSSGVWGLKDAAVSISSRVSMAAFILGWAGLCVHCQVLSFTGESDLSMRPYLSGKFLHGLLSAALIWLLYRFTPLAQSAANCYVEQVSALCQTDFSTALRASTLTAGIVWGMVCLISLVQMQKNSGNRRKNIV